MRLNIGLLGCGRISYKHINAIANNYSRCRLIAVCDLVEVKMDRAIKQYKESTDSEKNLNIIKYSDYNEMLENNYVDIIIIGTESGMHAVHAIDSMNKGKNVLVEKPMALSSRDAKKMIECSQKNAVKLGICHQNRFNEPISMLKSELELGNLGRLVSCSAKILWNRNQDYYDNDNWRGTWAMDGGALMNQSIHNIDLLLWLMDSEVETVYSQIGNYIHDIETEDYGAIIIRFCNGKIGLIEGSVCVYPKNLESSISFFGDKGTVEIGGTATNETLTWVQADGNRYSGNDVSTDESVYGNGHTMLLEDFIESIKTGRTPAVNGIEGKKALDVVLAAYKSQLLGKAIKMKDFNFSTTKMTTHDINCVEV